MNASPKHLQIQPIAANDSRAIELARIWAAQGKQHVSLATGLWKDPAAWGVMLVDLAKHVANAYEQTSGEDHAETLLRIREGFEAEWTKCTDTPTGKVL